MRLMNDLVTLSREYGSDPNWVVAGGGNTSLKDGETLYIKASGYPLATIGEEGFAHMDRAKLAAIWKTDYPSGTDAAAVAERERLVLADMMAARLPGESRRPSVETLLHDILPWPLVVHLHPTLINGLTCGADGRRIASELIGDKLVWIPYTDPGYVLANVIKLALEDRTVKGLGSPEYIFLENHGIFAGGRDADEVRGKYERLNKALEVRLQRRPGIMPAELTAAERTEAFGNGAAITDVARDLFGADACVSFAAGGELEMYLASAEAAAPLTGCLTPDHIVYSGPGALYLNANMSAGCGKAARGEETGGAKLGGAADTPEGDASVIASAWESGAREYINRWGKPPNLTLFNGPAFSGALVAAAGEKALKNAVLMLKNALEVCAFSESFGGPKLMEERFVRFIVDWEVENYRSKIAAS